MADRKLNIIVIGKDKASGVLRGVGSSMSGLAKLAGGAALGVAGAGVAIGGALMGIANDAAPMQGIGAAFEGIAGQFEGGSEAILGALQSGSLGMVSNRDLMMTYNEAAQLVGTTFANQLPEAMGYLGKVSAATGQDMGYMLDSITKGVGRLSPMILDNLGIQVAISEATERASEMFGVEADTLTKAQTQAGMMNVVLEKLAANTEAMPDITENASTQTAQMAAQMQNLKDKIGVALLPMMTRLMSGFTGLAEKYAPLIIEFFESSLIPFLTNTVAPALDGLANFLGRIIPEAIEVLRPVIETLMDGFATFFGYLSNGHGLFAAFQAALGRMGFANVSNWLEQLSWRFGDLAGWLGETIPAAIQIASGFWTGTLQPALTNVWSIIQNNLLPVLSTVAGWFNNDVPGGVSNASGALSGFLETTTNIFNGILSIVGPIFNEILSVMQIIIGTIVTWVTKNWDLIQHAISDTMGTIETIIKTVLQGIKDFWTAHGEAILGFITTTWATIKLLIQAALNVILGIIQIVLGVIAGDWESVWSGVKDVANNVWKIIKAIIKTAIDTIKITLRLGMDAVKVVFTTAWDAIKGIFSKGKEKVLEVIGNLKDALLDAGAAIVRNLKAGISNAWADLEGWFRGKLDGLRNLLPFSEPKDSRSGLRNLGKSGAAIIGNILSGFDAALPQLQMKLEGLGVGGPSLAGAAAGSAGVAPVYIENLYLENVEDAPDLLQQLQGLALK